MYMNKIKHKTNLGNLIATNIPHNFVFLLMKIAILIVDGTIVHTQSEL